MSTSTVPSLAPSSAPQAGVPVAARVLVGLLAFQGIGALGGGATLVADPSGEAMGWTTAMLADAPFSSFRWPGLILGVGLGVSALVLSWAVARRPHGGVLAALTRATRHHWSWLGSLGLGVGLMAWIVAQLLLVDVRSWLQPFMFVVGAVITAVALLPSVRSHLRA